LSFTGNYTCDSFKSGLINGDFDFDTDTIKMALYTNSATLNEDTAAYTTTGEISASGYTAGGVTLTVEKGLQITPPSSALKTPQSLPLLLQGER
jgi:hypothetical protein